MAEKNYENLVAKAVRTIQANERHSGAKTKKRGEVSGGGKKPWKQKGTGRARAGSSRSPIWRGGGIAFGPTGNQNHSLKINKKEKELALKTALDAKKKETKSFVLPKLSKTKEAAEFLAKNEIDGKVLILANEEVTNVIRVFKNIPEVSVLAKGQENVLDVIWADKIVVFEKTEKPAKKVENKEALPQGKGKEAK